MRIDEFDSPGDPIRKLLARLQSREDSFVERKKTAQPYEIRRAVVAFANSLGEGQEGVVFIGVEDDGRLVASFDFAPAERKAREAVSECYPPIEGVTYRSLQVAGVEVLAVVVPHSQRAPHFAGKAYVRIGASSPEASEEMLERLIADRMSPAGKLRRWIGKDIAVQVQKPGGFALPRPHVLESVDADGLVVRPKTERYSVAATWERVRIQPRVKNEALFVKILLE